MILLSSGLIAGEISFSMLVGILAGPFAFAVSNLKIILKISVAVVGKRAIVLLLAFFKYSVGERFDDLILDLVFSAILPKNWLNALAIVGESCVCLFSIIIEFGTLLFEDLQFKIDLIPSQTFFDVLFVLHEKILIVIVFALPGKGM